MKKKIMAIVPFLIMPIFIPIYSILDNLIIFLDDIKFQSCHYGTEIYIEEE